MNRQRRLVIKNIKNAIEGCILGTAAGDSMGLLYENLSPSRLKKLYKDISSQRFFFGRGMISDDTEHTLMTASALIRSGPDAELFSKEFARQLKRWFFTMPLGVGFASLRACLKLLAGFSPDKSGVFSAGNGPMMRIAILGVCFGDDEEKLRELVKASTRITHTDKKAENASLAVAVAAHISSLGQIIGAGEFYQKIENVMPEEIEFLKIVKDLSEGVEGGESTPEYARRTGLGSGVTGYAYHTAPAVLHCWLRNQRDFRSGVLEIIGCGGDTDTAAAILGAITGAGVHREGIPAEWTDNIAGWPYTIRYMEELAFALDEKMHMETAGGPAMQSYAPCIEKPIFLVFFRNLFFLTVLTFHIIRRMLPPY